MPAVRTAAILAAMSQNQTEGGISGIQGEPLPLESRSRFDAIPNLAANDMIK